MLFNGYKQTYTVWMGDVIESKLACLFESTLYLQLRAGTVFAPVSTACQHLMRCHKTRYAVTKGPCQKRPRTERSALVGPCRGGDPRSCGGSCIGFTDAQMVTPEQICICADRYITAEIHMENRKGMNNKDTQLP